jgi:hypothetical protein
MLSFSTGISALQIKNLSLHLALIGGCSFIGCKMTVEDCRFTDPGKALFGYHQRDNVTLKLTGNLQALARLDPTRIRPHAISSGGGDLDLDHDRLVVRVPELQVRRYLVLEWAYQE